jgi:hypothetical protein
MLRNKNTVVSGKRKTAGHNYGFRISIKYAHFMPKAPQRKQVEAALSCFKEIHVNTVNLTFDMHRDIFL